MAEAIPIEDMIRLEDMTGEAQHAATRSRAYAALVWAFDYPDAEFVATVRSGALAEALRATLGAVDPALAAGEWSPLEDAGATDDDLAVEYTRLFDVGTGGPPCPLYGGLYGGARMQNMEECVRFYNHFGLTLAEAPRELPDHISTQLEFLHFLAFREAEAWRDGRDPGPWQRAGRDFLERHPGRWVPKLRERLAQQNPLPFFAALVDRLERFLAHQRGQRPL
ncbi:MAG: putative ethylbenzene dehydrogenase (S25dD4) [Deltaproteobacteria bacterium]|nr:putative ethylbenzene dehydrogenase (S25dD4) [Deltaproteobacteria bacterium]